MNHLCLQLCVPISFKTLRGHQKLIQSSYNHRCSALSQHIAASDQQPLFLMLRKQGCHPQPSIPSSKPPSNPPCPHFKLSIQYATVMVCAETKRAASRTAPLPLTLGTDRPQLEQRMNPLCPRPCLLRPWFLRFTVMAATCRPLVLLAEGKEEGAALTTECCLCGALAFGRGYANRARFGARKDRTWYPVSPHRAVLNVSTY